MAIDACYGGIDRSNIIICPECSGYMMCDEDFDYFTDYGHGSMVFVECQDCYHEIQVMFMPEVGKERVINKEILEKLCQSTKK